MSDFFESGERFFLRLASWVVMLGGMGLIFATLVTCVSIVFKLLRRVLDAALGGYFESVPWAFVRPILGEEELVTYAVGVALFSALPWAMINKAHIKIDLFTTLFGERLNRGLDLLGDFLLALIAYLIMTRQWFLIFKKPRRSEAPIYSELLDGNFSVLGARLRDNHESQILGFPLWPTYVIAEICVILFFLTACFCVIKSLRLLICGPSNEGASGPSSGLSI